MNTLAPTAQHFPLIATKSVYSSIKSLCDYTKNHMSNLSAVKLNLSTRTANKYKKILINVTLFTGLESFP